MNNNQSEAEAQSVVEPELSNAEIAREIVEAAYHDEKGAHVGYVERTMAAHITAALDAKDEAATTAELVFEGRLEPDEIRRFQEGIRDHLIHLGVPDSRIDGAGCDSGDPLDFTKAVISQAFGYFEEAATTAQAEARAAAFDEAIEIADAKLKILTALNAEAQEPMAHLIAALRVAKERST